MMKLNCLKGSSLTSCDEFPVEHVPCHLDKLLIINGEDHEMAVPLDRRTRVKRAQFHYLYLRIGKPEGAQPSNSICHLILTEYWSGWRYNGWRYKIYSIFNPVSPRFPSKLTCSKGLGLETTTQWCISDVGGWDAHATYHQCAGWWESLSSSWTPTALRPWYEVCFFRFLLCWCYGNDGCLGLGWGWCSRSLTLHAWSMLR